MNLPDIRNVDLEGKRVLMRVDFNVEFESGHPREIHKIKSVCDTLEYVLSKSGVKVALLSHFGRPKGRQEEFSFENFYEAIGKILKKDLVFIPDCLGDAAKKGLQDLKEGQVLMLENVRFYEEDEKGEVDFAGKLVENFDVYVNEAFGASHRDHASITKVTSLISSFAGLNLMKEIKELSSLRDNFKNPAVALIGGAKIETKIPLIEFFSKKYDQVLVGGKLGLEAEKQGLVFSKNVFIPVDYLGDGLDVGPLTVDKFNDYLKKARTIVWNGPLGKFEDPQFRSGTAGVLEEIISNKDAHKIAGGGETVQVLEENNLISNFDFISTGGGAMLEFLVKGDLIGLKALVKN